MQPSIKITPTLQIQNKPHKHKTNEGKKIKFYKKKRNPINEKLRNELTQFQITKKNTIYN